MDLALILKDYKLNIRTTGLIIHNNKVLVHMNVNEAHCCLPGGRIKVGESSEDAIKREIKEELGKDIEILEYVSTIENFFELKGTKYHEFMFVYKVEFVDNVDKLKEIEYKNLEGKEELIYKWIDLEDIEEYNLVPLTVREMLKERKYLPHIINYDLKKL